MFGRSRTLASGSEATRTSARTEARRLAWVASVFVWVGWFLVAYAAIGGFLFWANLTSTEPFTFIESLGLSLNVVAGPLFLALLVAGLGHFARLFALYVVDHSGN
jgi:hypothetical protein